MNPRFSIPMNSVLGLVVILSCGAGAENLSLSDTPQPTKHSETIHSPRQNPTAPLPLPTTSSSFNWWPYPPWGASTSTSMSASTVPGLSTLSASIIVTSAPVPSPSSTPASSPLALSNPPVSSVVHISALPPATSSLASHTLPKLPQAHPHPFQAVYILPLVGGIALGGLAAWFCYGFCAARRRKRPWSRGSRRNELEPGPPYEKFATKFADGVKREEADGQGSPSKYSLHGTSYRHQRNDFSNPRLWLSRALSTRTPSSFQWPPLIPTPQTDEDDPFLALPMSTPVSVPRPALGRRGISQGVLSLLGEYEYVDVDLEDNEGQYESMRSKSLRRGLADNVRRTTERGEKPLGKQWQSGLRDSDSDMGIHEMDEEKWVTAGGFLIVEEDPVEQMEKIGWNSDEIVPQHRFPSQPETPTKRSARNQGSDQSTPLPVRGSPFGGTGPVRVDSSVLPRSPPQITSPPMESHLLFSEGHALPALPSPQRNTSWNPTYQGRNASRESPTPTRPLLVRTPKERYAARREALDRVEHIVKTSLSQRDLNDRKMANPNLYRARA